MQRLHYANRTFSTGSDIARALIAYAGALARHHTSATIDIPVRSDDGTETRVNFLLGPASQIAGETYEDAGTEIVDAELTEQLRYLTAVLDGGTVQGMSPEDVSRLDATESDLDDGGGRPDDAR